MSLNLITGYSGTSHITSASDGCTNAGLYGNGKYVLNIAEKFGAEIISNNLIRIKSGYAINQGRKIELAINDYEEVEIDNGLQGVKRCDLIVIHYEKNLTTGIETGSVKVIKGTSGDTYSDPAYTSGDIINGANEDDFLLYRVKINGLSIEAVEPLFTVTESLMTLIDNMQENSKKLMGEADISKIGDGTVKGAIGALADSDEKINQSLESTNEKIYYPLTETVYKSPLSNIPSKTAKMLQADVPNKDEYTILSIIPYGTNHNDTVITSMEFSNNIAKANVYNMASVSQNTLFFVRVLYIKSSLLAR